MEPERETTVERTSHAQGPFPEGAGVHGIIAGRWSPYGFAERGVPEPALRSLFEAARLAPSSFNEQPWRFLVVRREDGPGFARMLEGGEYRLFLARRLVRMAVEDAYNAKEWREGEGLDEIAYSTRYITRRTCRAAAKGRPGRAGLSSPPRLA